MGSVKINRTARAVHRAAWSTAVLATTWMAASAVSAATLSGSFVGDRSSPASGTQDLTAAGSLDWAVWNYTTDGGAGNKTPSNRKASSPLLISDVTSLSGGSHTRGVQGSALTFTYTDGASPTSFAAATIGGVTDSSLNTANSGVTFTVKGTPGVTEQVTVYVAGFSGSSTAGESTVFTATLSGATTYTANSSLGNEISPKQPAIYTILFSPDSASDLLTITYKATNAPGVNAHVMLSAVAVGTVTAVPTPAALPGGLAVMGGGLMMRRRRRK